MTDDDDALDDVAQVGREQQPARCAGPGARCGPLTSARRRAASWRPRRAVARPARRRRRPRRRCAARVGAPPRRSAPTPTARRPPLRPAPAAAPPGRVAVGVRARFRAGSPPGRSCGGVAPVASIRRRSCDGRGRGRRAGVGALPPRVRVGVRRQQVTVELDVELGRASTRTRLRHNDAQLVAGRGGRQVVARREGPEDAGLVGGLVGARAAQPVGTVRTDDHDATPRVVRLHDRRQQVADGGARRRDDGDRSS